MGLRRVLVIGSQCDALSPCLSFLPDAAEELFSVLTDPKLGQCQSALARTGPLLDPTVAELETALQEAFREASDGRDTFLFAYVGHAHTPDGDDLADFYLLPKDAQCNPVGAEAVPFVQRIRELRRNYSDVDGFVALIDACASGEAAKAALRLWPAKGESDFRFEVLVSTAADGKAYAGCFTRTFVRETRLGVETIAGEYLGCGDLKVLVDRACGSQSVTRHSLDDPADASDRPDPGLYLVRNAARAVREDPLSGTLVRSRILDLVRFYQVTALLGIVAERTRDSRSTALVGGAGSGKSALAAALQQGLGGTPRGYVQAIAFVSGSSTAEDLARELSEQLRRTVPEFGAAVEELRIEAEARGRLAGMAAFSRYVTEPLKRVAHAHPVRLVVDGLDQLSTEVSLPVRMALDEIASDPALEHTRLIVTAREGTPLPAGAGVTSTGRADEVDIRRYLETRLHSVPNAEGATAELSQRTESSWLVARLIADLVESRAQRERRLDVAAVPRALPGLYDAVISDAATAWSESLGETAKSLLEGRILPVLSVLAVAGAGPVVPLALLVEASGRLGGPESPGRVRDVLVRLHRIVERARPGTHEEHAGLFHSTAVEYLIDERVDVAAAHRAVAEAIAELAPAERHDLSDPVHAYAFSMEAYHLWEAGEQERAVESLERRESPVPRENLERWRGWEASAAEALGADHPDTLATRSNVATWTGTAGNAREALRLSQELLSDLIRVLGADHPITLTTRNNIAFFTGRTGNPEEALRLTQELLPDRIRALGADHPDTLNARNNIAGWTGETGDARGALRLFQELLSDQVRVLGADHPGTLTSRRNIAEWAGRIADAPEALRLFQELLPDLVRVLGADHLETLAAGSNIAGLTGTAGNAREALRLFQELLPDLDRVLGADNPETLGNRGNIAGWTGRAGNAGEALRLVQELLPDQVRVLGADHPDTLITRGNIASLTGETE